jgi:hypothetical protein
MRTETENNVSTKLTSKKAIARAIAVKVLSLRVSLLAKRAFANIPSKTTSFREYTRDKALPAVALSAKTFVSSIRKLRLSDILTFLKLLSGRIFSWIKSFKAPSAKKIFAFIGQEVVANVVAWTAALLSSQFISNYVSVKNWKNGWGFLGKKDKTMVSQETFETIDWIVGYLVGLIMLLAVNHLMNQLYKRLNEE